jgi:hypothetical protein
VDMGRSGRHVRMSVGSGHGPLSPQLLQLSPPLCMTWLMQTVLGMQTQMKADVDALHKKGAAYAICSWRTSPRM